MRLLSTILLTASIFGAAGGMGGGLTAWCLLNTRGEPRLAVADLKKLVRQEAARLSASSDSPEQLQETAKSSAPLIRGAIQQWSQAHKTVVLDKATVLSALPDVTDDIGQLLQVKP